MDEQIKKQFEQRVGAPLSDFNMVRLMFDKCGSAENHYALVDKITDAIKQKGLLVLRVVYGGDLRFIYMGVNCSAKTVKKIAEEAVGDKAKFKQVVEIDVVPTEVPWKIVQAKPKMLLH